MKIALVLTGYPRFCRDFEDQLALLTTQHTIDWHLTFWHTPPTITNRSNPHFDYNNPRDFIEQGLKQLNKQNKHKIQTLTILDPTTIPQPKQNYKPFYCNLDSVYNQYWLLEYTWNQLLNYNTNYDLIIRSRPDIGLKYPLDLDLLYTFLTQHPNTLITPPNERHGPPPGFCDQLAIGLPHTMNTYFNLHKTFDDLYNLGIPYNPELLLQQALKNHSINYPTCNQATITIRNYGKHVPGYFYPDWGIWQN